MEGKGKEGLGREDRVVEGKYGVTEEECAMGRVGKGTVEFRGREE